MLKFLSRIFVCTYLYIFFLFIGLFLDFLNNISDNATWTSELEMFYFMLSMYLSSWWWVHGCMDELQHTITTGVMRLVVYDIFIAHMFFQD